MPRRVKNDFDLFLLWISAVFELFATFFSVLFTPTRPARGGARRRGRRRRRR